MVPGEERGRMVSDIKITLHANYILFFFFPNIWDESKFWRPFLNLSSQQGSPCHVPQAFTRRTFRVASQNVTGLRFSFRLGKAQPGKLWNREGVGAPHRSRSRGVDNLCSAGLLGSRQAEARESWWLQIKCCSVLRVLRPVKKKERKGGEGQAKNLSHITLCLNNLWPCKNPRISETFKFR